MEESSEKIRKLEAQVFNLKNIIVKLTGQKKGLGDEGTGQGKKKKQREFNFKAYCKRHVALHVCYFGWNYHGFAVQVN